MFSRAGGGIERFSLASQGFLGGCCEEDTRSSVRPVSMFRCMCLPSASKRFESTTLLDVNGPARALRESVSYVSSDECLKRNNEQAPTDREPVNNPVINFLSQDRFLSARRDSLQTLSKIPFRERCSFQESDMPS
jgi:hypothetical protein